uniref:WH2 domain-containing protein n=1 Tax=Amphiprion percula TaxID=161767 RepID=A0A3P8THQ8_AMPPE
MSTFGYRKELKKYEEVDEDELLATLSSAELQELERELADLDPDDNIPIGLRQKDQTAKIPTGTFDKESLLKYWDNENKKLLLDEKVESNLGQVNSKNSNILKDLKNALKPSMQEKRDESSHLPPPQRSSHDDLMAAIRGSSITSLKRVRLGYWSMLGI